ncbi:MAG: AraC family transcriptional regulator [Tabrizicola sp.]|nr:AraC family transcriptional regulator [Tabrizicola sp.]
MLPSCDCSVDTKRRCRTCRRNSACQCNLGRGYCRNLHQRRSCHRPGSRFRALAGRTRRAGNYVASHPVVGRADSVRAWEPAIALEAAGPPGTRSKRQTERRIKQWTGHARRGLAMYLRAENFFEQVLLAGSQEPPWSGVAHDLGFSDQSHMIRDTKRLTGFTPRALYRRLDEEPFWCYRVLGGLLA